MLYISSPGGLVTAGMAIYDTMQLIRCDVATICMGQASSMGSFILSAGQGQNAMHCHSRILIHQPLGGFRVRRRTSRFTRVKSCAPAKN